MSNLFYIYGVWIEDHLHSVYQRKYAANAAARELSLWTVAGEIVHRAVDVRRMRWADPTFTKLSVWRAGKVQSVLP